MHLLIKTLSQFTFKTTHVKMSDTTPTGTAQVYTHRQHTATKWNATKQAG